MLTPHYPLPCTVQAPETNTVALCLLPPLLP